MSVLKQITGLENISPLWNKKIIDGYLNPQDGLNLNESKYCIVGEAHGYNWPYGCSDCHSFSMSFLRTSRLDPVDYSKGYQQYTGRWGVTSEFMAELKCFIDHFNANHR